MVLKAEQQRVKALLAEAVSVLCKNGLTFSSELCVEGLIGITLDRDDVFLVNIKETFNSINKSYDNDSDEEPRKKRAHFHPKVEQTSGSARSQSTYSSAKQSYYARQHVARARKRATTPKFPNLATTSTPMDASHNRENSTPAFTDEDHGGVDEERKPMIEQLIKAEPQEEDDEDDVMFVKEEASQRTSCMSFQGPPPQLTYHERSASFNTDHQVNSNSIGLSQLNYSASEGDSHHAPQDTSQVSDYSNMPGCSNWDMSAISGDQQLIAGSQTGLQQQSPGRGSDQQQSTVEWRLQNNDSIRLPYQPLHCRFCDKKYLSKKGLQMHILRNHSEQRVYKCGNCIRLFPSSQARKEHVKSAHWLQYECKQCQRRFTFKATLSNHMRTSHPGEYLGGKYLR